MCCKLIAVDELNRPKDAWCRLCDVGKGCTIYPERPPSCQEFKCLWLQGIGPDSIRPDRSKVVMAATKDDKEVHMHVDPNRPDAWNGLRGMIKMFVRNGYQVFLIRGDKKILVRA